MNKYVWIYVLLMFLSCSLQANQKVDFQRLSFLEGCWKGETNDGVIYESWGNADGNLMLGASKTISAGKTEFFEFLSIVVKDDRLHYKPYVNGMNTISFPLVGTGPQEVEFSNPAHDFPKTIKYRREGKKLWIALSGDGNPSQYSLNSISCFE